MRTIGLLLPDEKPKVPCPVCGKVYASEKKLAEHLAKGHPDYKSE